MPVEDFGERAATEDEVEDWETLVKSGKRATRGFKNKEGRRDEMRTPRGASEPE